MDAIALKRVTAGSMGGLQDSGAVASLAERQRKIWKSKFSFAGINEINASKFGFPNISKLFFGRFGENQRVTKQKNWICVFGSAPPPAAPYLRSPKRIVRSDYASISIKEQDVQEMFRSIGSKSAYVADVVTEILPLGSRRHD